MDYKEIIEHIVKMQNSPMKTQEENLSVKWEKNSTEDGDVMIFEILGVGMTLKEFQHSSSKDDFYRRCFDSIINWLVKNSLDDESIRRLKFKGYDIVKKSE